jgi:hypothetical protein
MNAQFQRAMLLPTLADGALMLMARHPAGPGGDPATGQSVSKSCWPDGLKELVNTKSRIGGMFVNDDDLFFFAGTAREFSAFLADYAKIGGIEKHPLILHRGASEAGLLAGGKRWPCDWKLLGRPGASLSTAGAGSDYRLEIHFWTGGRIPLDEVVVPENVEIVNTGINALT